MPALSSEYLQEPLEVVLDRCVGAHQYLPLVDSLEPDLENDVLLLDPELLGVRGLGDLFGAAHAILKIIITRNLTDYIEANIIR